MKPQRILGVVDHFGAGGAQRQFVELACGLAAAGHQLEVFHYFPDHAFFRPRLEAAGVKLLRGADKREVGARGVLQALVGQWRERQPEAVFAFLDRPNFYAEAARWLARSPARLLVSERSHRAHDRSAAGAWLKRAAHAAADMVVANSHTHADWLRTRFPWLRHKVHCIYNGFDLDAYRPRPLAPPSAGDCRLLAIGRIDAAKDALTLAQALLLHHRRHGWVPTVSWVGTPDAHEGGAYQRRVQALLEATPAVQAHWHWLGERSDVAQLLASHHALVHPSRYEGLPNVVCEALCCGRPVLAAEVCDHPRLLQHGRCGHLFAPGDPQGLMQAITALHAQPPAHWQAMAAAARAHAEATLSSARMVGQFERLLCAPSLRP